MRVNAPLSFLLVFLLLEAAAPFPGAARLLHPQSPPRSGLRGGLLEDGTLALPYTFGVVNDDGLHYAELWEMGVRATTFEFQWKRYEPIEGVYDLSYVQHLRELLVELKTQGWAVQMVPGFHYAPDWVFQNYPDMYYVNQYGEAYNPDPLDKGDFRVINAAFNPAARDLIAGYLQRIFQDFDQSDPLQRFDAVRVGGGVQGELRYPPGEWNGHSNSFWAFDLAAQNPALSGIPALVTGWKPGIDPSPGSLGRGQLLVNPGFETTHPRFDPFAWSPADGVAAEALTGAAFAGSRYLQVRMDNPDRVHQFVRVNPSTAYTLSGWLKSGDGIGRARGFAVQYGAGFEPLSAPFIKLESKSKSWTQQAGSLTTAAEARFLKIELDGDRPGVYAFDELSLRKDGDTSPGSREIDVPLAFFDWYVQAQRDFQDWQVQELRKQYDGELHLVYAGKGLQPRQVTAALVNDLRGDGWAEQSSALYAGADYARHLEGLNGGMGLAIYLTGIEDPAPSLVDDNSPYPSNWSAAGWLASLAHPRGLPLWAENSGKDTPEEMDRAVARMLQHGYSGLLWAIESELFEGAAQGYASSQDYAAHIQRVNSLRFVYLPMAVTK